MVLLGGWVNFPLLMAKSICGVGLPLRSSMELSNTVTRLQPGIRLHILCMALTQRSRILVSAMGSAVGDALRYALDVQLWGLQAAEGDIDGYAFVDGAEQ